MKKEIINMCETEAELSQSQFLSLGAKQVTMNINNVPIRSSYSPAL